MYAHGAWHAIGVYFTNKRVTAARTLTSGIASGEAGVSYFILYAEGNIPQGEKQAVAYSGFTLPKPRPPLLSGAKRNSFSLRTMIRNSERESSGGWAVTFSSAKKNWGKKSVRVKVYWTCSITRLVIEQVLAKCSAFCCFLVVVV
jgi:hypothetical protein